MYSWLCFNKEIAITLCKDIYKSGFHIYDTSHFLEDFHFDYITLNMLYNFVAFHYSEKKGQSYSPFPLCHLVSSFQQSRLPAHFPKTIVTCLPWLTVPECLPQQLFCHEDESLMYVKMERKESLPGEIWLPLQLSYPSSLRWAVDTARPFWTSGHKTNRRHST